MSPHYWAGAGRGTKSPQQHAVGKVSRSRTHQFEGRQHRIEIVRAAERNLSIARFNGNDQFAGRDKVGYMPAKLATHISHALRPPPGGQFPTVSYQRTGLTGIDPGSSKTIEYGRFRS